MHWGQIRRTQRIMNGHGRAIAKVFRIGQGEGVMHQDRCKRGMISEACIVPKLYTMPKTHK